MSPLILIVPVAVHLLLRWLTKTDTVVGRKLKASDDVAWEMALEDKRRELDEMERWGRDHGRAV